MSNASSVWRWLEFMREDRDVPGSGQLLDAADVIKMAMGQNQDGRPGANSKPLFRRANDLICGPASQTAVDDCPGPIANPGPEAEPRQTSRPVPDTILPATLFVYRGRAMEHQASALP